MPTIQELLENRILASKNDTLKKQVKVDAAKYQKRWAEAVQFFQIAVNKDRHKEGMAPLRYMAIRAKLEGVREIDDLRWFYTHCLKYSKKKGNTFSKCFFGALKKL